MEFPLIFQRPTNYLNNYFSRLTSCIRPDLYSELHQNDPVSSDGSYSNPFLILDMIWNLGFVFVSVFVLFCTFHEKPSSPLRVWIVGYVFQCLLHAGFVLHEFKCRNVSGFSRLSTTTTEVEGQSCCSRVMKRLEYTNTITSSFWWVFGFYWIVAGGQSLLQDSPHLYWLVVVFLALDVFFMIVCIGIACIICLALFCCIPIVAIAYAMTIREGASEDNIRQLSKYTFHCSYMPKISSTSGLGNEGTILEPVSQFELSECCICLTRYAEGAELCRLPCNHHFHFDCISRWLRINATCPLCKFNIKAKGDALV